MNVSRLLIAMSEITLMSNGWSDCLSMPSRRCLLKVVSAA